MAQPAKQIIPSDLREKPRRPVNSNVVTVEEPSPPSFTCRCYDFASSLRSPAIPQFKTPDYGLKLIPVDFAQQVLPGTFEFALCHLVDNELDLSTLRARYTNDAGGAPAFDPAVLLKIVLLGYSRGLISSRSIATACRANVLFMAVSGDSAPHFTTVAHFISSLGIEVRALFTQVLRLCDREGLIGRELFAIHGVKLPSNASKAKRGTTSGSPASRCAGGRRWMGNGSGTAWSRHRKARAPWIRELGKLAGEIAPTARAPGISHGTRQGRR